MTIQRPYTPANLEQGRRVVQELHGLQGYDAWAEHIAQVIAEAHDIGGDIGRAIGWDAAKRDTSRQLGLVGEEPRR